MKFIWENNWFFIPVAMFFGFCGVIALLVPYSQEILFFNELRVEPFNSIFEFFSRCGEEWAYVIFGVAVFFRNPRYTAMIALVGLLCMPIGYVFKDTIGVDRPITYFEKKGSVLQLVLVPNMHLNRGQTSFPSGHTMSAFALYSMLTLMAGRRYRRAGLAFAWLAMLVGISRVFLVQHFLVDVLAGALIGLLLTTLIWIIFFTRRSRGAGG